MLARYIAPDGQIIEIHSTTVPVRVALNDAVCDLILVQHPDGRPYATVTALTEAPK